GGVGTSTWGGGPAAGGAAGAVSVQLGDSAPTVNQNLWGGLSVALADPPPVVNGNVVNLVSVAVAAPPPTVNQNLVAAVSVALRPFITVVSPTHAASGARNVAFTVTGTGFTGATALTFYLNGAADSTITVASLHVTNATQ